MSVGFSALIVRTGIWDGDCIGVWDGDCTGVGGMKMGFGTGTGIWDTGD